LYCKKCGAEISQGQKFCIRCGAPAYEEQGPNIPYSVKVKKRCPGAVFLAVSAAFSLIFLLISVITGASLTAGFIVFYLFSACVTAFMAVVLLMKKTDKLLFAAFAINAFTPVLGIICFGFSVWRIFAFICSLVIAAFVLLFTLNLDSLKDFRHKAEKLWFAPVILLGVYDVSYLIFQIISYAKNGIPFSYVAFSFIITLLTLALEAGAYLLICRWLVNPYKEIPSDVYNKTGNTQNTGTAYGTGYIDMLVHVLLTVFIFPVYLFIWIYKTTVFTNTLPGVRQRDPVKKLLLCMFVSFYVLYWIYITGTIIDGYSKSKNIISDIALPSLLLSLFGLMFIAVILLQSKINSAINGAPPMSNTPAYAQPFQAQAPAANADELMKYKQLLDMGAITPEEYENKKKQILGI
jgi:hypothetical protein